MTILTALSSESTSKNKRFKKNLKYFEKIPPMSQGAKYIVFKRNEDFKRPVLQELKGTDQQSLDGLRTL